MNRWKNFGEKNGEFSNESLVELSSTSWSDCEEIPGAILQGIHKNVFKDPLNKYIEESQTIAEEISRALSKEIPGFFSEENFERICDGVCRRFLKFFF